MLTLESPRFPVLGEVSFCVILCLIAKETEQGVTITFTSFYLLIGSTEAVLKHLYNTVFHSTDANFGAVQFAILSLTPGLLYFY